VNKQGQLVSVVIPTLNEEDSIGKVLAEIPKDVVDEVIVVDSSTDNTPKIAEKMGAKVIHEPTIGYGRALQTGIKNAKGDVVVYIDGDHSYDPKAISRLVAPIIKGECDVVLGRRLERKMLPRSMSPVNRFGNLMLSMIFDLLFLEGVKDTQSGFRAIRKRLLEDIRYENYGMPYVTEQLIKLAKKFALIKEVQIKYRPRIGITKLCTWTDGFKILKCIVKQRFWG
jgi:glycosyltransferase involved in cell wall biosynthesis